MDQKQLETLITSAVLLLSNNGLNATVKAKHGKPYVHIRKGKWSIAAQHLSESVLWGGDDYGSAWTWVVSPNLDLWNCDYATGTFRGMDNGTTPEKLAKWVEAISTDPCKIPRAQSTFEFACPTCRGDWNSTDLQEFAMEVLPETDWPIFSRNRHMIYLNSNFDLEGIEFDYEELEDYLGEDMEQLLYADSRMIRKQSLIAERDFLIGLDGSFEEWKYPAFRLAILEKEIQFHKDIIANESSVEKAIALAQLGSPIQADEILQQEIKLGSREASFALWMVSHWLDLPSEPVDRVELFEEAIKAGSLRAWVLRAMQKQVNEELSENEIKKLIQCAEAGVTDSSLALFRVSDKGISETEFEELAHRAYEAGDISAAIAILGIYKNSNKSKVLEWCRKVVDEKRFLLPQNYFDGLVEEVFLRDESLVEWAALLGVSSAATQMAYKSYDDEEDVYFGWIDIAVGLGDGLASSWLALSYRKSEEFDLALKHYEWAIRAGYWEAALPASELLVSKKKFNAAINVLENAAKRGVEEANDRLRQLKIGPSKD